MDLVAAAQLSFSGVCTDASLLHNCSAHVTEMLLCCSAFASLDQKSQVASSHFHSSIFSISSTKESHNHSSRVWFKPASMILLDTSSCCMHLSACSNHSCVSTAMGSVLSLPACVFGKIKRALAVDRGKSYVPSSYLSLLTHSKRCYSPRITEHICHCTMQFWMKWRLKSSKSYYLLSLLMARMPVSENTFCLEHRGIHHCKWQSDTTRTLLFITCSLRILVAPDITRCFVMTLMTKLRWCQ